MSNLCLCVYTMTVAWLLASATVLTYAVKVTVVERKTDKMEPQTLARVHVVATKDDIGALEEPNFENLELTGSLTKEEREFTPLPFPVDFRFYDVDHNGEITLHELIVITGRAENVQKAFAASDENGDGKVTVDEYDRIPWGYDSNDVVLQR